MIRRVLHKNSFLLLVLLVPAAIYGMFTIFEKNVQPLPVYYTNNSGAGSGVHKIADFTFTNQRGLASGLRNAKEKIIVANFFFTHCPVICPKMTANLKAVSQHFAENGEVHIFSFSVDPERDSVQQLAKYAARFGIAHTNWDLLTGEKTAIYKLARNSFRVVATKATDGPDDFIHTENFVLVDKKGRIRGYYKGTSEQETSKLIHDIKKLKHED
jgi:protein SCO1